MFLGARSVSAFFGAPIRARRALVLSVAAACLAPACSAPRGGGHGVGPGTGDDMAMIAPGTDGAIAVTGDMALPLSATLIYGHSDTTLYTVDPNSYTVTKVADFVWPSSQVDSGEQMTDIALDRNGNMVGISFDSVYAIDPATAACTLLAPFAGMDFNGLSFIYSGSGTETLVGAAEDGSVYQINPMTGAQTPIGSYGFAIGSSGDLVSVQGATYATVRTIAINDQLVQINPSTGAVTQTIGDTGVSNIWGLGYWRQQLFGFTESNGLVLIDVTTGQATPLAGGNSISWFGAGVTTSAPVMIQ